MKTFDEEYQILVRWFFGELEKTKDAPLGIGLDGEIAKIENDIGHEYRVKLRKLLEKYGKTE